MGGFWVKPPRGSYKRREDSKEAIDETIENNSTKLLRRYRRNENGVLLVQGFDPSRLVPKPLKQ